MQHSSKIFVFGNNREGQAGVAHCDESIITATEVIGFSHISRVITSLKQTYFVQSDGAVLSSGDNDANELGRTGKRSLLQRIDAIETFQVVDIAAGEGFVIAVNKDGSAIGWGRNEYGQLGID